AGGVGDVVFPAFQRCLHRGGGWVCESCVRSGVVLVVRERALVFRAAGHGGGGNGGDAAGTGHSAAGQAAAREGAGGGLEGGDAIDIRGGAADHAGGGGRGVLVGAAGVVRGEVCGGDLRLAAARRVFPVFGKEGRGCGLMR